MLFTFPSRYLFTIGLPRVFSLAGWSRRIHAGFLVSRATQDVTADCIASHTGLSPSAAQLSRSFRSQCFSAYRDPTTPDGPEPDWFGLFPGRSPLLGESFLFSSPAGTKMFQFPAFASLLLARITALQTVGFSHSDIRGSYGHLHLTAAFRSLSRPSSPVGA